MRWYQHTTKIYGKVESKKMNKQVFFNSKDHGLLSVIKTVASEGIELFNDKEIIINGRIKKSSSGQKYLWVDEWKPKEDESPPLEPTA